MDLKALSALTLSVLFLSSCHNDLNKNQAQGYIEGRYTYMSTSVSGVLKDLPVKRGSLVKAGQTLFVLEQQPESDLYQAAVENLKNAKAARDAISANLEYAKLTFERYKVLVPKGAIQQSQLDSAKATYDSTLDQLNQANATVASNMATLAQSAWTKNQKTISAPRDAIVFDTYYRIGEYTTANQSILSLIAPEDIKVIFYVREAVLGGLHLGDEVHVQLNGTPQFVTGKISFISPTAEYTPPIIFSDQTSEKLIFRIEADFKKEDALKLHPGQPAIVSYSPHG